MRLAGKNTRQPRGAARIDYSNPIAARLVAGMSPAQGIFLGRPQGQTLAKPAATQAAWRLSAVGEVLVGGRNDAASPVIGLQNHTKAIAGSDNVTLLTMGIPGTNTAAGVALANLAQNSTATSFAIEHGDGASAGVLRLKAYIGGATRYVGSSAVSTSEIFVAVARHINGVEQSLWVNGKKDPGTGAYAGNSVGLGWYGGYAMGANAKLGLSLVWNRGLADAEILAIMENPWQVFASQPRRMWFVPDAGVTHTVTGDNVAQSNQGGHGGITQTHALGGGNATQASLSNNGSIAQSQVLGGDDAAQANLSDGGSIGQSHVLGGNDAVQAAAGSSGGMTQSHELAGDNVTQSNQSSNGGISQSHALGGDNATQTAGSGQGGVVQIHGLAGNPATQTNAGASGGISLPSPAADYWFVSEASVLTWLETSAQVVGFDLESMPLPTAMLKTEAHYVL